MIVFLCKHCTETIKVSEKLAGRKGKCPKCGEVVRVPRAFGGEKVSVSKDVNAKSAEPKYSSYDMSIFDVPKFDEDKQQDNESDVNIKISDKNDKETVEEEEFAEEVIKRSIPWPVDVLLYPLSKTGIIVIVSIIAVSWLVRMILIWMAPMAEAMLIWIIPYMLVFSIGVLVIIVFYLYLIWYMSRCIHDTAEGGFRAPDTSGITSSIGDSFMLFWRMLILLAVLVLPVICYYYEVRQTNTIFWILFIYSVIFLPMGFLAVVMFDSLDGLNPIRLVRSIFSVLLPYCVLVFLIVSVGFVIVKNILKAKFTLFQEFLFYCVGIYSLIVAAHLLGCFYRRYEHKLGWNV